MLKGLLEKWFGDESASAELRPWMAPAELSQVKAVFAAVEPKTVVEWGSGGSTRAFLEAFSFIDRYVSVEHIAEWHDHVAREVDDPRLDLHLVEPSIPQPPLDKKDPETRVVLKAWKRRCETDRSVMAEYIDRPASLGVTPDLALVDGRARCFCIHEGFRLLRPGGVLILHDAQREEYHGAIAEVGGGLYLEPWEQGQVCIVRKPA